MVKSTHSYALARKWNLRKRIKWIFSILQDVSILWLDVVFCTSESEWIAAFGVWILMYCEKNFVLINPNYLLTGRTAMPLIRLGGVWLWSEYLLCSHTFSLFCHVTCINNFGPININAQIIWRPKAYYMFYWWKLVYINSRKFLTT